LFRSGLQLVFTHVFKIKFVEMGKPAVPAPDGKMPATDGKVVRAGDMAVPAFGRLDTFPEVITANIRERSFFADILDPGDENPGSPAVVADNLGLVRHGLDDLVGDLLTMIAVRAVTREDEPFAHGR
jgi:hypothetical protein